MAAFHTQKRLGGVFITFKNILWSNHISSTTLPYGGVWIQWNGMVDWNGGMDWNGMVEWTGMVDWNGMVEWNGTLVISIGGHLFIKTTSL